MAHWFAMEDLPLRIGAHGDWYHGQEPLRGNVAALFARHVEVGNEGAYVVRLGHNVAALQVDDAPYQVVSVAPQTHSSPAPSLLEKVRISLSDGSQEWLDPGTLMQSADHVLYCRIRRGDYLLPCRFAPQPYHVLALWMEHDGSAFVLPMQSDTYAIAPCTLRPLPVRVGGLQL